MQTMILRAVVMVLAAIAVVTFLVGPLWRWHWQAGLVALAVAALTVLGVGLTLRDFYRHVVAMRRTG